MEQTATAPAISGHTKQYVFVDEYNRHKRLKVMRACDGCRKRKIRCDGALQNGPWPCGACQRLKLKCIPPTLDQDEEQVPQQQSQMQQQQLHLDTMVNSGQHSFNGSVSAGRKNSLGFPQQQQMLHDWASAVIPPGTPSVQSTTPIRRVSHHNIYTSQFANGPQLLRRNSSFIKDEGSIASTEHAQVLPHHQVPNLLRSQTEQSNDSRSSSGQPEDVDATVKELSEAMGDLNIDHTAIAPYIANQKKVLAEAPAIEESEVVLPPSVSTDSTVRIPPEMMPNKERVMDYFGYFFAHIHPYVPVLNRRAFYEQWAAAPMSVSPLILEGIFACTTRYLDEPIEVRKWLSLAARHEESFKDVPRLSTIQAMILLTKAREFVPKRGYYYRSWMSVKYMTTMAFDLGLHEHHDQHRIGEDCKFSRSDCMMRTRIWQTLLGLEMLVGHVQGRTDYAVQLDAVEFDVPNPSADVDSFEYSTTRRHTYFAQVYRNIKQTSILWHMMKKYKKDWALDPSFMRHNEDLTSWIRDLPDDLQVTYPDDGSPPFIGDHYIAYLHIYHQLVVVMHHRPQMQALLERKDPAFKTELEICANAATLMCRLQEALFRDYGLHGLQFMQRGINFTIYCVLTCTMLHCAAITSPDPTMNSSARSFFTRHMRILEECIPSAPPDMQIQIENLREAFSKDTKRPFELKPSLGMRSPSAESDHTTPPTTHPTLNTAPISIQCTPSWPHVQDELSSKALSPTSEFGQSLDSVASHSTLSYNPSAYGVSPSTSYASHNLQRVTSANGTTYAADPILSNGHQTSPSLWDPSGILDQWNAAFPQQPAPPTAQAIRTNGHQNRPPPVPQFPQQHSPNTQRSMYMPPQIPSSSSPVGPETAPVMPVVTPVMWQDAFSTAYVSGHGNKRHREDGMDANSYNQYQKRRA